MTEEKMKNLILSKVPVRMVTHHRLWRLCGSPQLDDSALFDRVLLSLADSGQIASGVVHPDKRSLIRFSLKGYVRRRTCTS